jgi:VIT1/CCC1 family predicted Fe2+/Mn2+ transporter
MTIDTLIMFAGAFVALLPFLGFPSSWDRVLLLVIGIFIIALGIVVRRKGERLYRAPLRAGEDSRGAGGSE